MAEDLQLLKALGQKMDWLTERQKQIAQNIANADTAGYRPHDLKPIDFKQVMKSTTSATSISSGGIATTNSNHIASGGASASGYKAIDQRKTYEVAPAGNAVILEEQILRMNETMMDHRFISNMYQKNVELLNRAVKGQ